MRIRVHCLILPDAFKSEMTSILRSRFVRSFSHCPSSFYLPRATGTSLQKRRLPESRRSFYTTGTCCSNIGHDSSSALPKSSSSSTTTTTPLRHQFQVYNSLTGQVEPISLSVSTTISSSSSSSSSSSPNNTTAFRSPAMYTCGPTVYAPAHLGHARTYVWLDIFRRVWEAAAHPSTGLLLLYTKPLFCLNITDVDDKILATAQALNEPPLELARRYERDFWKDWDALNCLRPTVVTRVTDLVESDIIPYIERLIELGMAYQITVQPNEKDNNDNDDDKEQEEGIYFDVRAYEDQAQYVNSRYGKLAPPAQSSDLVDNNRTSQDSSSSSTQKRDARDFALWKKRKEGERMYWSSPWGDGRPGWHIECSAMIEHVQRRLNNHIQFVVHAGGMDLKFPHHTNEIAQAEAYHLPTAQGGKSPSSYTTSGEWIPHWIHTGHLHIDGLKMSKSLKNFITVEEMLNAQTNVNQDAVFSSPADDFRWWCLSTSYRRTATYSETRLQQAQKMREKVVQFLVDAEVWLQRRDDDYQETGEQESRRHARQEVHDNDDDRLLTCVLEESARGKHALFESDLDGTTFLSAIMQIVDQGSYSLNRSDGVGVSHEAVQAVVDSLRSMLSLVGFTEATSRAGQLHRKDDIGPNARNGVGESTILDELVSFRATIRKLAMEGLKRQSDASTKDSKETIQEILKHCDKFRDNIMPSMGVELMDSKLSSTETFTNDKTVANATWRYCVPRLITSNKLKESLSPLPRETHLDVKSIPLQDYFRVEQYEGQFLEFDETGFPLLNADGSELSNRQRKKLLKKREKHSKRLQESDKN